MNELGLQSQGNQDEEQIDLWELLNMVRKRALMIVVLTALVAAYSVYYALSLTNIFQATALIQPTSGAQGGLSSLASEFGGLASMAGISMPSSSGASEIVVLLNSNILKEKIINDYSLMPILFSGQWDEERGEWNVGDVSEDDGVKKMSGPTMWAGIRKLGWMFSVRHDRQADTIRVSVQYHDPEKAAEILTYTLNTLTNHLADSAKRVADINKKYLEKQISRTSDPIIRQKIYGLISQQVETAMMTEVKENFAFKVLDPPRIPDERISPQRSRIVLTFTFVAFICGILLALALGSLEKWKKERDGIL